ncbi:MAG: iron-siderophore ABC transporter substrate-binding protein [Shinella sp.]|nr:iron-siderophore ABC transporter substrate-binding protein [Shinella sp.]
MTAKRMDVTRRTALGLIAGGLVPAAAYAAAPRRVAIIDWAALETALAIGVMPVAASELLQYRQVVCEPAIPERVTDIGLRGTPNLEALRLAEPDLILISNFYEYRRPLFETIAPVLSHSIYQPGVLPYEPACRMALEFGRLFERAPEAAKLIADSDREIADLRGRLSGRAGRPVFLISIGDQRHFRAFGSDSMFGDVLNRLGLQNAWKEATSYSATAPIGFEALAREPDAFIVVIGPIPPDAEQTMQQNGLWNALPAIRNERVAILDPVNHFGGLPAARRFVRLLGRSSSFAGSGNG